MHGESNRRRGADLALVHARVPALRVPDLQHPVLQVWRVDGLEALVAGVRVAADGEQMQVSVPDPRHLQQMRARHFRHLIFMYGIVRKERERDAQKLPAGGRSG
jgi:hypothetical protein